ncbi:ParB/RepB/Spo0J family partition protein [Aureimonas altamirensis]|uniref:ParB/RepB/Spo0J family partition protein n=1 Tax=Aureimonas altamirensis TaxID=370622 RepID=UPI0025529506|nr:ParB/RepB/Spo0J family partition protein [Aureimonas altamirensis]
MSGKPMFEGIDLSGLDDLRMKDGTSSDAPQGEKRLPLTSVIEDPDQPRTTFDDDALKELAASISKRGVLQPIIVRPANADGKHVIVMGARRYRASLIAKAEFIPVIIRAEASDGFDQMIENIQREALSHRDIAAFVRDQIEGGTKASAIASSLGKPRSWVSFYIPFFDMDPAIQEKVESYGIRTAYELHNAMGVDADRTRAFIAERDTITQRAARDFAQSLKGKRASAKDPAPSSDTASSPSDASVGTSPTVVTSTPAAEPASEAKPRGNGEGSSSGVDPAPGRVKVARFAVMVGIDDRIGRLDIDQPAKQGSNYGTVILDNGKSVIEVALSDLKIIEIVRLD